MRIKSIALLLFAGALLPLPATTAPAGAAVHALIQGSGSSWAANLVNQWVADLDAEGLQVVYTASGSTQGRADFAQGAVDFAVTDLPYEGTDELGQPDSSDRDHAYVPVAGGGTAFAYRLDVDGARVQDLRLSSATLAGIFTGAITSWADPAVTADNNGRVLPDLPVVPVVRADAAGSTVQVTGWLDATEPGTWQPYLGRSGSTAYYPTGGGVVPRSGADGLLNTVKGTNGAIGYVEASYPYLGNVPVAKVRNTAGYFVAPTGLAAAIGLRAATLDDDGAPVLDAVYTNPDPRAYPVPALSSLVLPTAADDARMTTAKRQVLAGLVHHALCDGQLGAPALGYAPLPRTLVEPGLAQLAGLGTADPAVDLTGLDLAHCTNPTFDAADPSRDLLDETVPLPSACDRPVSGPCGAATEGDAWPSVTGRFQVGSTLHARPGAWSGPGPYDHQWYADGRPISGATAASYVVAPGLRGHRLAVRVLPHGQAPVAEDTTAGVVVEPGRIALNRPRVTGRPVVGRTLRARFEALAGTRVRLIWYAGERRIGGARTATLRLTRRLTGRRVWVLVTATRPGYTRVVRTSRATAPVQVR